MSLEVLFDPLPGKGVTRCNRTACQRELTPEIRAWNTVTEAWYCWPCARRINQSSPGMCIRDYTPPPDGKTGV